MYKWTNGCTSAWVSEWVNVQMNQWIIKINHEMNERISEWIDWFIYWLVDWFVDLVGANHVSGSSTSQNVKGFFCYYHTWGRLDRYNDKLNGWLVDCLI